MTPKAQRQDLDPDSLAPESMHGTVMLDCPGEGGEGGRWTSEKADVIVQKKWMASI